jgi:flap endonuclease-1
MDTLAHGCPRMIRNCMDKSIKRKDVVSVIDLEDILKNFNMNMKEFLDLCILCGCDYCPSIPKVGTVRSYNYIQNYRNIEALIQSKKCNIPEEFIQKYDNSRKLFEVFKDKIDLEDLPIHTSSCDYDKLNNYLINDCAISEKRVENALKKINVLV